MPVDSALAALFPGPASGSGDDELECLSFLPVLPRRGLPRTGSIHAGLNRGARQWDLKSRYLCLERAGKPRSEEVLEEDSSEDESWDMTDKNCLAAPSLMDLPMHAGRRPCSDGREDGAHVAHRLIRVRLCPQPRAYKVRALAARAAAQVTVATRLSAQCTAPKSVAAIQRLHQHRQHQFKYADRNAEESG
jgi:hypothetical protein